MNHLLSFISKYSTRKNIVSGLIVITLVNLVVFPYFLKAPTTIDHILDIRFGFDKQIVNNTLNELGNNGRTLYFWTTLLIDTPYAFFYGFIYAFILAALLKSSADKNHWQFLIMLPFFISLFDIIENLGIIYFIKSYPNIDDSLIKITSLSNQLKWIFAFLTTISIFLLFIIKLFSNLKKND
ncbi:MAG TPA: hypothetical protein ENK64_02780 [Flavobacteriales bacterium]|jgi:hypothetical protein|nr:hypothetical protein [Flavobacteriales bacterium]